MTEAKVKSRSKKNKLLMWVIIANVVLWSTLAILLVFNQDNTPSDPKYLAYTMSKQVITDKLKAPSTAKFQPYSDDGDEYEEIFGTPEPDDGREKLNLYVAATTKSRLQQMSQEKGKSISQIVDSLLE